VAALARDSDAELDDAHLMRLPGRSARRVRAWAGANGVPVIDCKAGQRRHRIAGQYLAGNTVSIGVFLILVARARATVQKVRRSAGGGTMGLEKKTGYVNHYSFHIMDPARGHLVIKMSGHPPFGAQAAGPENRRRVGPAGRQRPGSGSRGAWHARVAWATMPGWLVLTAGPCCGWSIYPIWTGPGPR
jgi:hypothetical protein